MNIEERLELRDQFDRIREEFRRENCARDGHRPDTRVDNGTNVSAEWVCACRAVRYTVVGGGE